MTNFRNLKIAINDLQPLDEVVSELERLGFVKSKHGRWFDRDKIILTSKVGTYSKVDLTTCNFYRTTTLAELKEM